MKENSLILMIKSYNIHEHVLEIWMCYWWLTFEGVLSAVSYVLITIEFIKVYTFKTKFLSI